MAMDRLFQLMKDKNASDMFFAINSPIHLKINGNLLPINQQKMDEENIMALLAMLVSAWQALAASAFLHLNNAARHPPCFVLFRVIFQHLPHYICRQY